MPFRYPSWVALKSASALLATSVIEAHRSPTIGFWSNIQRIGFRDHWISNRIKSSEGAKKCRILQWLI